MTKKTKKTVSYAVLDPDGHVVDRCRTREDAAESMCDYVFFCFDVYFKAPYLDNKGRKTWKVCGGTDYETSRFMDEDYQWAYVREDRAP